MIRFEVGTPLEPGSPGNPDRLGKGRRAGAGWSYSGTAALDTQYCRTCPQGSTSHPSSFSSARSGNMHQEQCAHSCLSVTLRMCPGMRICARARVCVRVHTSLRVRMSCMRARMALCTHVCRRACTDLRKHGVLLHLCIHRSQPRRQRIPVRLRTEVTHPSVHPSTHLSVYRCVHASICRKLTAHQLRTCWYVVCHDVHYEC